MISLVYSSTNYSSLDDLKLYIENYDKIDNLAFDNTNLGLKIMPGYNTESNVLYMERSNDVFFIKISV
jgi:hypothetical protein